jgi:hypothetical protein
MYFDITKEIDRELDKIGEILEFNKGKGLVIAVESIPRSTVWNDIQKIKGEN